MEREVQKEVGKWVKTGERQAGFGWIRKTRIDLQQRPGWMSRPFGARTTLGADSSGANRPSDLSTRQSWPGRMAMFPGRQLDAGGRPKLVPVRF